METAAVFALRVAKLAWQWYSAVRDIPSASVSPAQRFLTEITETTSAEFVVGLVAVGVWCLAGLCFAVGVFVALFGIAGGWFAVRWTGRGGWCMIRLTTRGVRGVMRVGRWAYTKLCRRPPTPRRTIVVGRYPARSASPTRRSRRVQLQSQERELLRSEELFRSA